jgi:hypothetical protein
VRGAVNFCSAHSATPALCSPFSNRCCRCAEIVLQNGCQVVSRVTDVCGESVIHGITSEIPKQRAGCQCVCAFVSIKWFDFSKRSCFCNFDLACLPYRLLLSPPIFPLKRRITRKVGYKLRNRSFQRCFPKSQETCKITEQKELQWCISIILQKNVAKLIETGWRALCRRPGILYQNVCILWQDIWVYLHISIYVDITMTFESYRHMNVRLKINKIVISFVWRPGVD